MIYVFKWEVAITDKFCALMNIDEYNEWLH